jgi:hypothetical protein
MGVLVMLAVGAASLPAIAQVTTAGAVSPQPHRNLPAAPILLVPPDTSVVLLSLVPAAIHLQYRYSGAGQLAFSLLAGPADMTVEPDTGVVRWTPAATAEGTNVTARVSATDGTSTAEVSFRLWVALQRTLATTVAGQTLTVTEAGSLQGLAITLPAGASLAPAQVKVSTIWAAQAPPFPDGVAKLSEFFRVTPVDGGAGLLTLALPTAALPAGRRPEEVRLFVYTDAAANAGPAGEIEGYEWVRVSCGLDVLPSGGVTIRLQGLGDLAFIGLDAAPAAGAAQLPVGPAVGGLRVGATAVSIVCTPFAFANGLPAVDTEVCGLTGDVTMNVIIRQRSQLKANPPATREELLGWLVAGRKAFTGLGLAAGPSFEVVVETMPDPTWLGFVSTGKLENRRVLHITNAAKDKRLIQGTAVHEYFHHAQSRSTAAGKTNLIDTNHRGDWLVEGTARWFEDEVFDGLNTYAALERTPFSRILKDGVAALPDVVNHPDTRPYTRWAFWKMVSLRCSGFSIPDLLNVDAAADPKGIVNFKEKVESARWQCDFGAGFGDANRATLASALLYYSYATEKEDDLSLLDANEPFTAFARPGSRITPTTGCTSWDVCPAGSIATTWVNPAGVDTYRVNAVSGLAPGQSVTISVESVPAGRELWVWAGDNEKPGGLETGSWYRKTSAITHTYADGTRAPETMLFVVNPDPTHEVIYRIRASVTSTLLIWSVAPILAPGSPGADMTLTAYNALPWPATYKLVWSFNDGTQDVTANNTATVTHRWATLGDWPVVAKLYSLSDNVLRSQAEATARIRAFHGAFALSQFTGSHTGCVYGDTPATWDKIAAGPASSELYLSFAAPLFEAPTNAWLYYHPESTKLRVGADDPAMTAQDCPHVLAIQGGALTARYANGVWGNGAAATCVELHATQAAGHLEGTLTQRDTNYQQAAGGNWQLVCRGDAAYSFKGDWSGL